jgi:hypothetical protein
MKILLSYADPVKQTNKQAKTKYPPHLGIIRAEKYIITDYPNFLNLQRRRKLKLGESVSCFKIVDR